MQRVKVSSSDYPGADYKWVVIPTHWKVVAKSSIQKGDKVYRFKEDAWMDVWIQISRPVSLFNLVIRPVPTSIGWDINSIMRTPGLQ